MSHKIVRRMSAGRHTLTVNDGKPVDLSRYFTVTRNTQGIRYDRAGEYQRGVVG